MAERQARIPNASRQRKGGDDDADVEPRRGTGRTVRGRRTRQALLDAARRVFERDGFLRARIADICDEAGISYGSFYTYFVSKEEVFNQVVDSVELDLLQITSSSDSPDPVERIHAANRAYLEAFRQNAAILRVIQQVATFDADVHATRQQRQDDFAHAIERRTREYQAEGLADPDIDPWFAANALGGMVAFVAEQAFIHEVPIDLDHATDQVTRLWANALRLPVAAPSPRARPTRPRGAPAARPRSKATKKGSGAARRG